VRLASVPALLLLTAVAPVGVTIRDMFVDSNGDVLFESTDHAGAYFGDHSGVDQLPVNRMCGTEEELSISFPEHTGASATFSFGENGGRLECGARTRTFRRATAAEVLAFQEELRTGSVPVFALGTADRIPKYLFRLRGTRELLYVEAPREHGFLRLWVGEPPRMVKKALDPTEEGLDPAHDVLRTREGDVLIVPLLDAARLPTWNGETLELLDLASFDLRRLGIPGVPNLRVSRSPCR